MGYCFHNIFIFYTHLRSPRIPAWVPAQKLDTLRSITQVQSFGQASKKFLQTLSITTYIESWTLQNTCNDWNPSPHSIFDKHMGHFPSIPSSPLQTLVTRKVFQIPPHLYAAYHVSPKEYP
ncbi:hypothetical protein AYI68_g593 [Smittium mucronatum]|uniref:Uncharacterized protein n=1 Tax=Smittium mucronatum TaxID=133383 RepID=A0A1R0H7Z0_9FUNG|nr:hypothetical protein AYI68_g593 [Smittium mucronatum]